MSLDLEAIRDELAGWPIGSGYYQTKVSVDEAREMAEALVAEGGPVAEVERMAALSALKKMANRWQWCDWPVMAEVGRGCTVIGQAQRVTDWMNAYVEAVAEGRDRP